MRFYEVMTSADDMAQVQAEFDKLSPEEQLEVERLERVHQIGFDIAVGMVAFVKKEWPSHAIQISLSLMRNPAGMPKDPLDFIHGLVGFAAQLATSVQEPKHVFMAEASYIFDQAIQNEKEFGAEAEKLARMVQQGVPLEEVIMGLLTGPQPVKG